MEVGEDNTWHSIFLSPTYSWQKPDVVEACHFTMCWRRQSRVLIKKSSAIYNTEGPQAPRDGFNKATNNGADDDFGRREKCARDGSPFTTVVSENFLSINAYGKQFSPGQCASFQSVAGCLMLKLVFNIGKQLFRILKRYFPRGIRQMASGSDGNIGWLSTGALMFKVLFDESFCLKKFCTN